MALPVFKNVAKMMTAPFRERGVRETLRSIHGCLHALRREKREAFDLRFGTDTGRRITWNALSATGDDVPALWRYFATLEAPFQTLMRALPNDLTAYTFVDLGSGKGRVLLMASEFPFRRIVGVELSPALHGVALHNVERYQSKTQRCSSFELLCGDAATFVPPDEDLVVYLFQPFPAATMASVLRVLVQHVEGAGRRVVVAYMNPLFHDMVLEHRCFRLHEHRASAAPGEFDWSIYVGRREEGGR